MRLTTILTLLLCCTLPAWSIEKFNLVPVYGDAYWTDSLPAAMRDSYIRAAERQVGKPWMNTNVALFSLYRAEGDREKYQQFVYKKRNQLAALAMGELMEARGRCPEGRWLQWVRDEARLPERTAQQAMHLISFLNQKFGQVGSVLTSNTCN